MKTYWNVVSAGSDPDSIPSFSNELVIFSTKVPNLARLSKLYAKDKKVIVALRKADVEVPRFMI